MFPPWISKVLAHLPVYLLPQGQEIRKGVRFILLLAEQGGGVERAHEPDAAFFNKGAVLFGHGEIRPDHPLGGNAAQADHDLGLQDAELLPQPGHTGLRSRPGSGSRFWGGRHLTMLAI